ncbi:hypothetical protein PI125_g10132 [Phytophthora idaei]|nr:hypothetical protein PI125_g10132 [Phytophthora idaei]
MVKGSWGYHKMDYLGHRVLADGLEAHPKNLESLANLPFPLSLQSMQSFLGSLNYYCNGPTLCPVLRLTR